MNKPAKISGAERVRAYRARKRAQGLRPVTFWLPDLSDPAVEARIREQCKAIAASKQEKDDLAFVDSLSTWLWEPGSPWVWDEKD